jgi:hypothetical protein
MKRNLFRLVLIAFIPFLSCREEVDVEGLLSFPPAIKESFPFDNGQVVIGSDFDVRIIFADGANSPLSSASVTITDANGAELYSIEEDLAGTIDSVNIDGAEFDASSLSEGDYTMTVVADDVQGNSQTYEINFSVITSLYPANNDEMYIAGEFNGWGATPLTLVAAYTWEVQNINLQGGKWKFKNTVDWSDTDWGDGDCDGTMEEKTQTGGSNADTDCDYNGLVNIQFNDQTRKYTITPAVSYEANISGLYLLGTFNEFSGPPDYGFVLTANHTWVLDEIRLKGGDAFKFAETKTFQGTNFGDANFDMVAEEFGSNVVLPEGFTDAFYSITFNDETLQYSIDLVRMPYPDNLYLVGGSTSAGWNPGASIQFMETSDGKFEIYAYLDPAGGGFKFLEVQDWAGDWGQAAGAGEIEQEGEDNVTVSTAGFYRIVVDFTTLTYSALLTNWGVIGDAQGSWDTDTDLTFTGGHTLEGDVTFGASGAWKFRANDAWDINLGDNGGNSSLEYGGDNIARPGTGSYHIKLILAPTGYTYEVTPN